MKKLAVILALILALVPVYSYEANALTPSISLNTQIESGINEVYSVNAKALKEAFEASTATDSLCFMACMLVDGDTGIAVPVLKLLYASSGKVNASSVAFCVNDTRYVFSCANEKLQTGKANAECLTVYLDENGLKLLSEIAESNSCVITLYGNGYATKTCTGSKAASGDLLGSSVNALDFAEGAPSFDGYVFEDLSIGMFKSIYGIEPKSETSSLSAECSITLDKTTGVAVSSTIVKPVQQLLKDKGFFVGATTTTMSDLMISAIKNAQRYYGFIETGYADAALINALETGVGAASEAETAVSYSDSIGGIKLMLNRAWTAKAFDTTLPGNPVTVSNSDNVYVIIDGTALNETTAAISLGWEFSAKLTYNGEYTFDCVVYTELDGGATLSATLGVLSEGRLIIACEVPARIASSGSWMLTLSTSTETSSYRLS